ncbi:MAG: tetratricopeptide repeat protein, partial [Acidimicrobiia bacterium]|nr:tetratricopeptide repeat protein [Acidimicrobiia bacterium]
RQAQADQKARGLLERARGLLDAGWPAADLTKVTEASALASQADDVAQSDGAGAAVRQEAEAFRDHAAGQLQRLEKDRALREALQDVLVLHQPFTAYDKTARHSLGVSLLDVDNEYARAFRGWGLDVGGTAEDEAAARLAAEPDPVAQEVIAALDGWMLLRLRHLPGADWRRLARLAENLDDSRRRRQLRALVIGGAPPRAADIAGLAGLGSPWPAAWELARGSSWRSLLELRKDLDVRTEPVPTLLLFAYACTDVGDLAGAEEVLRHAVAARPHEVLLLAVLARLLERQGPSRSMEAVGYFRAAYSLNRHHGPALGRMLFQAGKPAEAEELLRELGRQPPFDRNAVVPLTLSDGLRNQKRYAEAEAAAREAVRLRPDWEPAWATLTLALLMQQKYAEAEAAARQAITLGPTYPDTHLGLSYVLLRQQKYADAEAAARQAIALQPNFAKAWINLGSALCGQGKYDEGEAASRKAIALAPGEPLGHDGLGNALQGQGKDREAEAAVRQAIALAPEIGDFHNNLGRTLFDQKKDSAAEAAFREAIRLGPDFGVAYRNLGHVLLRQARFNEAATALQKVGEFLPAGSPVRQHAAQLEQFCKWCMMLDARFAAVQRGAVKPGGATEQIVLAQFCYMKKSYAAAARYYRDAFAADPKLAESVAAGHRYNAACAAALAGCGHGQDAGPLDDAERARWRGQARAWLRQDLAAWAKRLEASSRFVQAARSWRSQARACWRQRPHSTSSGETASWP